MPKLDLLSCHEFWKNYDDPMIYRVISFIETVEDFTLDGTTSLEQTLDKLGKALDELNIFEPAHEDDFITFSS